MTTLPDTVAPLRGADRAYVMACLVGAAVSAAAACGVLLVRVPLQSVPATGLVAGVCAILALEWLVAAGILALNATRRPPPPARPVAATDAPAVTAVPARPAALTEAAATDVPAVSAPPARPVAATDAPAVTAVPAEAGAAGEAARGKAAAAVLQDRIGRLTAALTLAAAAGDLNQVGTIVQDALTADLELAGTSTGD